MRQFDIDRPNLGQQLTFGHGIHRCLGFALARLEAEVLVAAVAARYPDLALGDTPPVPQTTSLLNCSFDRLWLRFR